MDLQPITEEEYEAFLRELFGPVLPETEEREAINMGLFSIFGGNKRADQENLIVDDEETTGAHDPLCTCDECMFHNKFAQLLTYEDLRRQYGSDYANSWLAEQE